MGSKRGGTCQTLLRGAGATGLPRRPAGCCHCRCWNAAARRNEMKRAYATLNWLACRGGCIPGRPLESAGAGCCPPLACHVVSSFMGRSTQKNGAAGQG